MDSWEEAVSDVMYAGGMQCEATMLESKALIGLDAEMENLQNHRRYDHSTFLHPVLALIGHCDDQCEDDLLAR